MAYEQYALCCYIQYTIWMKSSIPLMSVTCNTLKLVLILLVYIWV